MLRVQGGKGKGVTSDTLEKSHPWGFFGGCVRGLWLPRDKF